MALPARIWVNLGLIGMERLCGSIYGTLAPCRLPEGQKCRRR